MSHENDNLQNLNTVGSNNNTQAQSNETIQNGATPNEVSTTQNISNAGGITGVQNSGTNYGTNPINQQTYNAPYTNQYNYYPNYNPYMYLQQPPQEYYDIKELKRHGNWIGFAYLAFLAVSTIAVFAYIFISVFIAMFINQGNVDSDEIVNYFLSNIDVYALNMIATIPAFLLVYFLIAKIMKYKVSDLIPVEKVPFKDCLAFTAVCMSIGSLGALQSDFLTSIFNLFDLSPSTFEVTASNRTPFESFVLIFSISVVPAFIEEFAYRGVVFGSLKKFNKHFAVFASSLLFGLMHGNMTQAVFAFALGLALGYTLLLTKNIFIPIFVHFFNNFMASVFEVLHGNFLKLDAENLTNLADYRITLIAVAYRIIFFVAAIFAIKYLFKKYKNIGISDGKDKLPFATSLKTFCATPGVIIFFVVITATIALTFVGM